MKDIIFAYRWSQQNNRIEYRLNNKNYNDLALSDERTPMILVLLCLPEESEEWLNQDVEGLMLKKCAYWHYLGGETLVGDNKSTTLIRIPEDQIFSIDSLNEIFEKIRNGAEINS